MSPRPASRTPRRSSRLAYMPRWLRAALTGWAFFMFFSVTLLLGTVMLPLALVLRLRLGDRATFTRRLNAVMRTFTAYMRDVGLIAYWPIVLPEGYEGRGCLVVANHPSLIDVVLTLSSLPQLACVAKASWYDSILMGPMLRRTTFIPGPDLTKDPIEAEQSFLTRLETALRGGQSILVFPEGTRSSATSLHRFTRGAIEAAVRAGAPILPLFIDLDEEFLMKGVPFWRTPPRTPLYVFEWFDPIETAGARLDGKKLTRELQARYEERFAKVVAARAERNSAPEPG